jgi:hypothetical protein
LVIHTSEVLMVPFIFSSLLTITSSLQPLEIEKLIQQLGSPRFAEREAATKRLEAIGEPAVDALRKAVASNPDAEIRRRASSLLAVRKVPEVQSTSALAQFAGRDGELASRWRRAYALWQRDPRRAPEAIKTLQAVSEAWLEKLPDLPPAAAVEETHALLAAALEMLEGRPKDRTQGLR